MSFKKRGVASVIATIGLGIPALVSRAKNLADAVAIYQLPHDLGELLMAISKFPEVLALGLFLVGLSGLAFLIHDFLKEKDPSFIRKGRMIPFVGMIVFGFGFLVCAAWYILPYKHDDSSIHTKNEGQITSEITLYSKFREVIINVPQLGKPITPVITSKASYQASHDNAVVIWVGRDFIVFPLDAERKWFRQPDPEWSQDQRLYDDDLGRALFGAPKDRLPPYGGIGNHWLRDPKTWRWIGWRKWHCSFVGSEVYSQEFENGTVYGVYRLNNTANEGQILIAFKDGTWRNLPSEYPPPACERPYAHKKDQSSGK